MKIPDTIIAKVREFREKDFLDPPAVEAYLEQALLDVRRETEQELSTRFREMQERYPEFCLDLFYDEDSNFVFINTTEYHRTKD